MAQSGRCSKDQLVNSINGRENHAVAAVVRRCNNRSVLDRIVGNVEFGDHACGRLKHSRQDFERLTGRATRIDGCSPERHSASARLGNHDEGKVLWTLVYCIQQRLASRERHGESGRTEHGPAIRAAGPNEPGGGLVNVRENESRVAQGGLAKKEGCRVHGGHLA